MDENQDIYTEPLTDWAKEPSITDLRADLESARSYHDTNVNKIQEWNDLRDIKGKAKPKKIKGHSVVQPKLVRRQAEWRYPALSEPFLNSEKMFTVQPVTFEDSEGAYQNELILNHQFRTEIDSVSFIDDFVRSVVDDGTCFVRLGWERESIWETVSKQVFDHFPIQDPEMLEVFEQVLNLKTSNPREYNEQVDEATKACIDYFEETGIPTTARPNGFIEVEEEKIKVNRPVLKVMDPDRIFVDPSCEGDFSKALFVVEVFETNRAELTKAGRYKNLDKINWSGVNTHMGEVMLASSDPSFSFKDPTRKKTLAYEYWGFYDIHGDNTLVPIVATWVDNVLIRLEENPFPDQELPYVRVVYSPVKRELYGEPDAELLSENQQILGAVTRGIIDLMGRSANAQEGMAKNMLDPLNKRRFLNGENYEFNPSVPPSQGYILHKYPEVPNSALTLIGLQNQDAEALTGIKSFSGGLSGNAYGDVATGIRGIIDAAAAREMNILRRLAKGMQDIGRKIISMNSQFLRDQEVIRITNDNYVAINREDLTGDFDLVVDISTTKVDEVKAQDLAFLLQTASNMDPKMYMNILSKIARLKRMPELAHELKQWQPEPDPFQQQMQQLEMAKAQQEVAYLQAMTAYYASRAEGEMADADATHLDNELVASGEKHRRGLEQQKAQAKGNQELQITKSLLQQQDPNKTLPDVEAALGYNALTS